MDENLLDRIEYDEENVDIEAIMLQIREYLAEKHGKPVRSSVSLSRSTLFDNDLYDQLYQANQTHDKLYAATYVTPSSIPLVGALWQKVRAQFHALVVFYVARLAEAQMRFNASVVRVLNGVVQGIDTDETPDRLIRLEGRVRALEERLAASEQAAGGDEGGG